MIELDIPCGLRYLPGGLVGMAGIQGYFLLRADQTARISANAAKDAAMAAIKATEFTRKTFIAANRQKLIVRDVVMWQNSTFQSTFDGEFEGLKEGDKIQGHLVVVNIGGIDATIEFIDKMFYWTKSRLPMVRPYDEHTIHKLNPTIVLPAGEGRQTSPISCNKPMGPEARDVTTRKDKWRLYVMGWIRYRDELGTQTHMKFCREWQYPEERFSAINDPHYESEQ